MPLGVIQQELRGQHSDRFAGEGGMSFRQKMKVIKLFIFAAWCSNLYTNFQLQMDRDCLQVLFGEHRIHPRKGIFTSGNGVEKGQCEDVE